MYTKILVPYDKSEPAQHALAEAVELASATPEGSVTVLNVVDHADFNPETFKIAARMAGVAADAIDAAAMIKEGDDAELAEIKQATADIIAGHEDAVEYEVAAGSPHDAITAFATQGGYDCIVMGHRGLGAVRGMLGSVCYSVLHKTAVPVLIVK